MRIEYVVTEDEYVEASLASMIPTRVRDRQRVAGRRRVALLIWLGLIVWWIVLVAPGWRRSLATTSVGDVCVTIGRYEWVLPWALLSLANVSITRAFRKGRGAVRRSGIFVGALYFATVGVVIAAELATSRKLLLGGFGMWRAMPWIVIGALLLRLVIRGWSNRAYRTLYAHTPYASGRQTIEFDESGVRDTLIDVTHHWRWAAFDDARRTERLLLLTNRNGQAVVLLPTRAIGSRDDVDALFASLKSRVATAPVGFAVEAARAIDVPTPG